VLGADAADGDVLDVDEAAIPSPSGSFSLRPVVVDVAHVLTDVDVRSDAVDLRADTSMDEVQASITAVQRETTRAVINELDRKCILFARKAYPLVTRSALFVVFFWFGLIKLLGVSPATGMAMALTARTVGLAHFGVVFNSLAVFECAIGVLFLIPRAVRIVIALLCIHMAVVCSPLVLVPGYTWQEVMVPTMDGQYIIKNLLIIAAAIGLLGYASPRGEVSTARSE
jgi:uncharacterized membrane protein YphA (DoxX/SURF4 family)